MRILRKNCKSNNSLAQHIIRCIANPDRIKCESGFKGKRHSAEARAKLSKLATEQHANGKGVPPPGWSGKKHSDITKQKIAAKLVGNTNGFGRGKRSEYNGIVFRSTWEAKVAEYLDKNCIEWKYEEKAFLLEGNKSYRPDFFIYENGVFVKLIEVKGYFRESNKLKFDMFKIMYSHIEVELWDKLVLKQLSLI